MGAGEFPWRPSMQGRKTGLYEIWQQNQVNVLAVKEVPKGSCKMHSRSQ